ncbi:unnamed protein product [Linum tenue]|uniref:WRKY domain-containing protein n=1 Tax=Linum tenue TaxID=586396 RepID=A0AAV0R437_9ROSI|nr:unnamed protein product [Linum tenue]
MGTSYFSQNPTTQGGKKQEITIIKELVQGQELTSQLQLLLQNQSANGGDLQYCYSPTTTELLHKISRSFTDAISALSTAANGSSGDHDHENHQAVSVFSHGEQQSSAGSGPFEEDSGESRKRPPAAAGKSGAAAGRDNRGTYKRRKTGHSSVIISPSFSQDGHGWRKYGQKEILHAKFPRSYFRCTHKHEQGCKATKQVQRLEQEDEMYSITYLGHHTCKNALAAAAAVLPPFVDARATAAAVTPSVKQEVSNNNEESKSGVTVDNNEVMIGNDGNMNMWQDFVSFDLEAEEAVSNYGYDYGNYDFRGRNVASDSAILDMDFSVNDIDFDDGFRFDSEQSCGFF